MNLFRRLPLSRLLLLCGLIVAIGASATALASALGGGPTPAAKPLAQAIHDSLAGPPVDGVSANITLTNHLLEGANLAGGAAELASNPLLNGGSGRLWIAKDGRARLELQAEKGDTQVIYDGHTVSVYDASTNTLYRYTPKEAAAANHASESADHEDTVAGEDRRSPRAPGQARRRLRRDARPTWAASRHTPCASRRRKAAACSGASSCPSTPRTRCR